VKPVRALLCAALLTLAGLPAWAQQVSRDDAAAMAQRQTGGRVLSVDQADAGGRPVWRVKVVTGSGDVRVVLIDMGGSSARDPGGNSARDTGGRSQRDGGARSQRY
jgi:hypothetical protein